MHKIIIFLAILVSYNFAYADVYKYVDPQGNTHYTDEPPNKKYKRIIRTKVITRVRNKGNILGKLGKFNQPYIAPPASKNKSYSFRGKTKPRRYKISRRAAFNKQKYSHLITQAAKKFRLSEDLLHAVIQTESAYNPTAVSPAGAVGLMQLMPATARRYGVKAKDRKDPRQSINAGANYLRDLLRMFKGNRNLAVAGYNAGEGAVRKYKNQIPPYRETQNYVKKINALLRSRSY